MTEHDWNDCTAPLRMLEHLRIIGATSDRKLRLFVCACCHRALDESPYEELADAVDIAEDSADGRAKPEDLADAKEEIEYARWEMCESLNLRAEALDIAIQSLPISVGDAARAVEQVLAGWRMNVPELSMAEERAFQCRRLRCLFGNPFRHVVLEGSWLAPPVVSLVQAIYDERSFHRMPHLAELLAESGCTDEGVLGHCRSLTEHVRGCWVVDALLGKA